MSMVFPVPLFFCAIKNRVERRVVVHLHLSVHLHVFAACCNVIEQYKDMTTSIGQLLDDIAAGRKYMKVYRQMKMYNDPALNPVLYGTKK